MKHVSSRGSAFRSSPMLAGPSLTVPASMFRSTATRPGSNREGLNTLLSKLALEDSQLGQHPVRGQRAGPAMICRARRWGTRKSFSTA